MSTLKYLEKNRIIPLILTLLLAVEIFYFSSLPSLPQSPLRGFQLNIATIYHIIVFFLFTFFLFIVIKGDSKLKIKHIILVICISIIYAISDEFHQLFVSGRSSTIKDVLIDLIGVLLAIFIYPKKEIQQKNENTKKKKIKKRITKVRKQLPKKVNQIKKINNQESLKETNYNQIMQE